MHKIVKEQDKAVDKVLGKHHKFMEFANNSTPVQNAVASSSTLPVKSVEPSLQDSLPPAPAFKSIKEYDEHEKKRRNRMRKAKKAKKDSIHLAPSEIETTQNVQVFPEVEYEEPLDWGTPSAQDDQSSDEDSISHELAAMAGLSRLSLTLAPTRRSTMLPLAGRAKESREK
jgi:hypothetical protein